MSTPLGWFLEVCTVPMLYRAAIEHRRVFEAVHIDHHHDIALAVATPSKTLDAAGLAEQMIDHFGVEPIGRQVLFALVQGEIGGGKGLHDPAQTPAARAIAIPEARKVGHRREAHRAAMTLSIVSLFFWHGVLQDENERRTNWRKSQALGITIFSTAAALLGRSIPILVPCLPESCPWIVMRPNSSPFLVARVSSARTWPRLSHARAIASALPFVVRISRATRACSAASGRSCRSKPICATKPRLSAPWPAPISSSISSASAPKAPSRLLMPFI